MDGSAKKIESILADDEQFAALDPGGNHPVTKQPGKNVAVIGGGISGLASALFLARAGFQVTVYEASDQFGGLGTFFRHEGRTFERFYHCILPTDSELMSLIRLLGIEHQVYFRNTSFGIHKNGVTYPLNNALDLLRFSPLSFTDRLRLGVTGLAARFYSSEGLDMVTAKDWLTRLSGEKAFRQFWKPMLRAKFGDGYRQVPALWFWTRFHREKSGVREMKGYIHGGYKFLIDTLVSQLWKHGVKLHLGARVEGLDLNDKGSPVITIDQRVKAFDQVVFTSPLPVLRQVATSERMAPWLRQIDHTIDGQGVVNVVVILKRALSPYYWIANVGDDLPFQGTVETTRLMEAHDAGYYHLVYLLNYVHRSAALFSRDDETIRQEYLAGLQRMYPDLLASDILESYVFRAPFVETLYTPGYLQKKPPKELIPGRVYLGTASQMYPQVTSWNGAVSIAKEISEFIVGARVHADQK